MSPRLLPSKAEVKWLPFLLIIYSQPLDSFSFLQNCLNVEGKERKANRMVKKEKLKEEKKINRPEVFLSPSFSLPWDFFGGNAEAETPVLWPPHVKS